MRSFLWARWTERGHIASPWIDGGFSGMARHVARAWGAVPHKGASFQPSPGTAGRKPEGAAVPATATRGAAVPSLTPALPPPPALGEACRPRYALVLDPRLGGSLVCPDPHREPRVPPPGASRCLCMARVGDGGWGGVARQFRTLQRSCLLGMRSEH